MQEEGDAAIISVSIVDVLSTVFGGIFGDMVTKGMAMAIADKSLDRVVTVVVDSTVAGMEQKRSGTAMLGTQDLCVPVFVS